MKKLLLTVFIILGAGFTAFAIESSKPDFHTSSWSTQHGKRARVNSNVCLGCHTDRLECIQCHEDVKPRNHSTGPMKVHGMEARWNKKSCQNCHTEDFCVECHEIALPMNHKVRGFGPSTWYLDYPKGPNTTGSQHMNGHCGTSCQRPSRVWKNSLNQNCLVCHRTKPVPNHPQSTTY